MLVGLDDNNLNENKIHFKFGISKVLHLNYKMTHTQVCYVHKQKPRLNVLRWFCPYSTTINHQISLINKS